MIHARSQTLRAALVAMVALSLTGCTGLTQTGVEARPAIALTTDDLGRDDGYIPDGGARTLYDDAPAVTRLQPELLDALKAAEKSAAARDVQFTIADGWRSERYQNYLFDRAVRNYGSEDTPAGG